MEKERREGEWAERKGREGQGREGREWIKGRGVREGRREQGVREGKGGEKREHDQSFSLDMIFIHFVRKCLGY